VIATRRKRAAAGTDEMRQKEDGWPKAGRRKAGGERLRLGFCRRMRIQMTIAASFQNKGSDGQTPWIFGCSNRSTKSAEQARSLPQGDGADVNGTYSASPPKQELPVLGGKLGNVAVCSGASRIRRRNRPAAVYARLLQLHDLNEVRVSRFPSEPLVRRIERPEWRAARSKAPCSTCRND